ncbi:outer membrane beta-barrel protein [Myxococcus sp. CA039A]|uniref:outer membrane beta-barrel protein n=1 Tax=Myxococcus sp. CA039A TaxID=2741737 RepID=UPI00157B1E01|nr:outer membrane beta-barrel protein [Myxococcus sp. CA039A]NTX56897.1 outer membrane beta-barrel protein [Myxococcus sp. CA039A]
MVLPIWRAGVLLATLGWAAPSLAKDPQVRKQQQPAPFFGAPGLTVRGGVTAYTGDLGTETDVGTFLGLQADAQLLPAVGLELGYEGSANGFADIDNATLWRHNLGALAKVGPTIRENWKPFLGAGVGVSYLDATSEANARQFDDTFLAEVPLTAGVEYRYNGVTAGARATYRVFAGGGDFAPGADDDGDLFSAGLSLGGRF